MSFCFNVNLSQNDYLDFNIFVLFRTPAGRKQIMSMRAFIFLMFGAVGVAYFFISESFFQTLFFELLMLIVLGIFQLNLHRVYTFILKKQIKSFKKHGKIPLSESSVLEFYDDFFAEKTEDNRSEVKYQGIESVNVVRSSAVYIHLNQLQAVIIPISTFRSQEEFDFFVKFLNEKCKAVKYY